MPAAQVERHEFVRLVFGANTQQERNFWKPSNKKSGKKKRRNFLWFSMRRWGVVRC